jgi:hypothetical protein
VLPTSSLVVERTKENLKAAGLAVRCSVIKGSFFESIPAGAAYLFRHVIHDWTDEQCIQILGHCRKVIPANGKLLIVDCVVPAGNAPSLSKVMDITMLTLPGRPGTYRSPVPVTAESIRLRISFSAPKVLVAFSNRIVKMTVFQLAAERH